MEPTPYVQSARNRRRPHCSQSCEGSHECTDLIATPDVFRGSQAASGVQGAFCERLAAAEGLSSLQENVLGHKDMCDMSQAHGWPSFHSNSWHREDAMRDDPMSVVKQLPSPVVIPLADKHAAQPTSLGLCAGDVQAHDAEGAVQVRGHPPRWHQHELPSNMVFGSSPGNTPMPRRVRRSLCDIPEPPKKHGTPDFVPFTPFEFISGARSIQTCPGKQSYRLQRPPAKQHKVRAVRRTLDLRGKPKTASQTLRSPDARRPLVRPPLTASAGKLSAGLAAGFSGSPGSSLRRFSRSPLETPAPLFSLSEAEATVQPGRTQGRRGLPPLAKTLRKRSQEDGQQHAHRKMRAVQEPGLEGRSRQGSEGRGPAIAADDAAQAPRGSAVGMSPSSRMAALRLAE